MKKKIIRAIGTLLCSSFFLFAVFLLSRTVLSLLYGKEGNWISLIISGFRIDLSTVGYISCIEILLIIFVMLFGNRYRIFRKILCFFIFCVFFIAVFMEFITPSFVGEYGVRPNRLFFEYLKYPTEVFSMLITGRLLECLLLITIIIPSSVALYFLAKRISMIPDGKSGPCTVLIFFLIATPISVLSARGTLGHRPLNPASVAMSNSATENEIALNSSYSLVYAVTRSRFNISSPELYRYNDLNTIIDIVRKDGMAHGKKYIGNKNYPLAYIQEPKIKPVKPLNVVVILMESQGAQFSSLLNGGKQGFTPEFDRLSEQGWIFKRMLATGTRSIRGIEAVYGSFPPTTVTAVVKRDFRSLGFVTLGELYTKLGYETSFFYGGQSHFDNMKSYFLINGTQTVIDHDDYDNGETSFQGVWGYSDEDLYNKAFHYFEDCIERGKPYFSMIFTSSNHEPFDIPSDSIRPINSAMKRETAVQYADYVMGKFIEKAKNSGMFENTVFLIVADHDARVASSNLIPIANAHIPALFLGAGINPRTDYRVVSQLDLAPTLLSLTGVRAAVPFIGFDLMNPKNGNRALFQYFDNFSFVTADDKDQSLHLSVAVPGGEIKGLLYNPVNGNFLETSVTPDISELTKAYSVIGEIIYRNDLYRRDVLDICDELQLSKENFEAENN